MTITKADLASKIAELGVTEDIAKQATQVIIDSIIGSLKKCEYVKISRFGTFFIREKRERNARNPKTGEKLVVPAKKVPAFRPSDIIKEVVK